jgi:hypothetical protein
MIVAEEPTRARAAPDGTFHTRRCEAFRRNQPIVKALVIPFPVVMRREFRECPAQMGFAEDDDPIQAFLLNRLDESLRVRIAVGCVKRCLHHADAAVGQRPAKRDAPFGIPIADQDPVATEGAVRRQYTRWGVISDDRTSGGFLMNIQRVPEIDEIVRSIRTSTSPARPAGCWWSSAVRRRDCCAGTQSSPPDFAGSSSRRRFQLV